MTFDRRKSLAAMAAILGGSNLAQAREAGVPGAFTGPSSPFPRPTQAVPVAMLIDEGATIIDFCGPWEVFRDVESAANVPGFRVYSVAPSLAPIRTQGDMHVVPDFDYTNAPRPSVLVIPATLHGADPQKLAWIRDMAKSADIVMSVCSGAFILANTGLLDGLAATTHHLQYDQFQQKYPAVTLVRGRRFVDNGKFITAGGLTSSIDGTLHAVARFYGPQVARETALYLEHDGDGWRSGLRDTG